LNYLAFQSFDFECRSGDGYSRNGSCTPNLISTFLFNKNVDIKFGVHDPFLE
jgi:hypothetical protein